MTDQDRNKAWGFVHFSDDVRAEVGGKISLMGIYQADMFFPDNVPLPIMLAKLVVTINYYESRDAIKEDVTFRVSYGNGEDAPPLFEFMALRADIDANRASADQSASPEDLERLFSIRMPVTLSPFQIDKMESIKVRAHFGDGKVLKLGRMALKQVPVDQFNLMIGIPPEG